LSTLRNSILECTLVFREGADMMQPAYASPKRRRQILDDETDAHRFNASLELGRPHEAPSHEDPWVKSFIARLAGLIRHLRSRK
jgi:hypothetical protein